MNFRHQILNILHSASESRTPLALEMGVTKAYVTKLTAGLINDGIIKEASQQEIPFGRPVTLLTVVTARYFSVNILIREHHLFATLNDYNTTVSALAETQRMFSGKVSPEKLVSCIDDVIRELALAGGVARNQIMQTSIALQGGIEQFSGVVRWCPALDSTNVALKEAVEATCHTRVSVVNIAWCSCYMLSHAESKSGSWLAFMPGYGSLGFGYYLNGKPALGDNGFYPEIVHLPYEGGIENAFNFDANSPDDSAKKAADALYFAICCTAPVHNIRDVILTGEFFDEVPEWTIPKVQQQLQQNPNERINTIQLRYVRSAPGLSHAGLVRLSSDAITEVCG